MYFRYMPQRHAEAIFEPDMKEAMISITEPNRKAAVHFADNRLLRLQFDDHDPQDNSNLLMPGYIWDDQVLFTEEQAKQVIEFVLRMKDEGVEYMYVHCHAGISRSRAIVLAMWEFATLGGWASAKLDEHHSEWHTVNRHVYRTMYNALYGKMY